MNPVARRVTAFVVENFSQDIDLAQLANAAGMSRHGFCRHFQREFGLSPMKWLWSFRTILAAEMLKHCDVSLTDIAFSCGFTSSAHFSRTFKTSYGIQPGKYRSLMARQAVKLKVNAVFESGFRQVLDSIAAKALQPQVPT